MYCTEETKFENYALPVSQSDIDFNIKNIWFFLKVVELGNLSSAADELYVTQPYLSKVMKRLEENLGFSLFVHEKNRLILTEQGKAFYRSFRPIVLNIGKSIGEIRNSEFPMLTAAVLYNLDFLKLKKKNFINGNINFKNFNIKYSNPFQIMGELYDGRTETAIISEDYIDFYSDFEKICLGEIEKTAVVSEENELSVKKEISISDLCGKEIVIHIERNCPTEMTLGMVEKYCKKIGIDPCFVTTTENYQTAILDAAIHGKIVIGSELSADFETKGLSHVRIKDYKNKIYAIIGNNLSTKKRELLKLLYNQKA